MRNRLYSLLLFFCLLFSLTACESKQTNYNKTVFDYFDTVTTVSGYFNSEEEFDACFKKIDKKLEFYHKLFDIYNNYDKINNIKTINDYAGKKAVKVDQTIIRLLKYSKEIYNLTDKTVNVCAGPIIKLWKESLHDERLPDTKALLQAKDYISIDNLIINEEKSTVFLKKQGCSIDVGAVAKGFVCEDIKGYLDTIGFKNGIINLGGNVLSVGLKNGSEEFKVGIKNPDDTSTNLYVVKVSNKCVVTSGDYERFYEIEGIRYNHIINPKLLKPADNNKSVTIISDNAALADALSTALFIMDYNDGIKLINSIENCEACIIDNTSTSHFSLGFKEYLEKQRK